MAQIDTKGMSVAALSPEQVDLLKQSEQKMNTGAKNSQEIYLLAVTRQ